MAIYRNVQLSFWTDNKVEDEFTPEDKYFYLYLLTNPQTNLCGCYEVSYSQMTRQTGYNKDTINRLLERFEKVHNVIRYSRSTKEVLILHWYKYNWSRSEKVLKGVLKVAEHIKCKSFKDYVIETAENVGNNTLCIPYIDPMETSVSDSDTDTVTVSDSITVYNKRDTYKDILNNLLLEFNISDYLLEYVYNWIEYKKERRFTYKEQGLRSLIKTISDNSKRYGDEAVAKMISESIASGYQGIVWDKLLKHAKGSGEQDLVNEWRSS